jgi:transcriptional regulator with XRE-family HTH domain
MYSAFEYKFLASAITRARKQRKLTQAQLAAACSMNQTTVSRLENPANKHSVTLATLNKVAAAMGCNMRVVFKPAEAETLDLPAKKPEPTQAQWEDLTTYELERLQQLSGNRLINEVVRLQDSGKWVPNEFFPEAMRGYDPADDEG